MISRNHQKDIRLDPVQHEKCTIKVAIIINYYLPLFHPKEKNVRIIAIGIGQYEDFQGELEEIAGENVHNASNFDELSNLFSEILAETCSK